jgi:hypothetical protein
MNYAQENNDIFNEMNSYLKQSTVILTKYALKLHKHSSKMKSMRLNKVWQSNSSLTISLWTKK